MAKFIVTPEKLKEVVSKRLKELADAIEQLNETKELYRDLALEKVIMDSPATLKIASDYIVPGCITAEYISPVQFEVPKVKPSPKEPLKTFRDSVNALKRAESLERILMDFQEIANNAESIELTYEEFYLLFKDEQ